VGAAETDGDAEALGVADGDVSTELAGRGEKEEGERISDHDGEGTGLPNPGQGGTKVVDAAVGFGVSDDAGEEFGGEIFREVRGFEDFPAEGGGAGVDDGGGGGMETGAEPKGVPFRLVDGGVGERGGLSGGGALIEQRGVGDFKSGQFHDHGLEVEEGLQPALGDFRLIRGVGAVPTRILDDVSPKHRWRDRAMITEPNQGAMGLVLGQDLFQRGQGSGLRTGGREIGGRDGGEARGKSGMDEVFECFEAEEGEHLLLVLLGGAEMARKEGEILDGCGGWGEFGRNRRLFWLGGSGDWHFAKNKLGQPVGKRSGKVGLKGVGGVSLKLCTRG